MARCGRKCEVYSRIVGYYRPTSDWNIGKLEELGDRKMFSQKKIMEALNEENTAKTECKKEEKD